MVARTLLGKRTGPNKTPLAEKQLRQCTPVLLISVSAATSAAIPEKLNLVCKQLVEEGNDLIYSVLSSFIRGKLIVVVPEMHVGSVA